MIKKTLLLVLSLFVFIFPLFAEEESYTITTYYPSPYGVYKELKLYPNTSPNPCDINNKGAMYYNDADNQVYVCDGSSWKTVGAPSGTISMFATACPTGWTRFAALDNKFPRGSATYGGTGGDSSHVHSYSGRTSPSGGGVPGGLTGGAEAPGHTHPYSGTTNSANNLPPYLDIIWCQKN